MRVKINPSCNPPEKRLSTMTMGIKNIIGTTTRTPVTCNRLSYYWTILPANADYFSSMYLDKDANAAVSVISHAEEGY